MVDNTKNGFRELGNAIAVARLAAGLAKQSDLAGILSVSQQTVSRWESGVTKPKEKQLVALAAVLKLNVADLRRLTHDEGVPAVSYVEPFPVDRLDPTTFESFAADLMQAAHPEAEVRRAGGTGHTQDGLDVEVTFPDGRRMGLQCKRVQRFGPADAKAAISAFPASGFEKVLVLSLVASPQTAKTVKSAGWTVWDKDDLSRRARCLPIETQERIVDIYFRGQRLALLGRSEPGPWLTTEEFFRPFAGTDPLLSHDWDLLGRESEINDLLAALVRPGVRMALLVAAGGMGKSRLLKESMEFLGRSEPLTRIRFLSSAADLSRGALDDLGPGPKVIVVDDAHDRGRLGILFEYAADASRQVRLVLATRPYALDRIRYEAARFNFVSPPTIALKKLKRGQLRVLAGQILSRFGLHAAEYARYVVDVSGDSPLIVAMASRALAKDGISVEIAQNEGAFRDIVLSRFREIAVHVADAGEEKTYRDVLDMLALVQPFHPQDHQLLDGLEQVQGIPREVASRVLDRFAKGGVTYRRGHEWRLMPDVLGDYLIETSCRTDAGRLSVFAEKVLGAVKSTLLKHALLNLGRLDWRLNEGNTADSALLSGVWHRFDGIEDEYDPRLDAIEAVAPYQPRQALEFIVRQARRKRRLKAFSAILRGVAQSSEYLKEVMTLLWELGRNDDRTLGPHPDHPMRVLTELGGYGGHKPLAYNEALLDLGLDIIDEASSWTSCYTPLDVLRPLLRPEGTDNSSDGRAITFTPYFINYEVTRRLRMAVINLIVKLLRHPTVSIARAAGCFLQEAVRYPHGLMGSTPPKALQADLTEEAVSTLKRVQEAMIEGCAPVVMLAIARSISWHANHGTGPLSVLAGEILSGLPNDIEFRVLLSLVDGWGRIFIKRGRLQHWQTDLDKRLTDVVSDLRAAKPEPHERLAYIEGALAQIDEVGESQSTAHRLIQKLLDEDAFARALIEEDFHRSTPMTRTYVGAALAGMMRRQSSEGRAYLYRHIGGGDIGMMIAASKALAGIQIADEDEDLIAALIQSPEPQIVYQAIKAVWLWRVADDRKRVRLLLSAHFSKDVWLLDELAMVLCDGEKELIRAMTEDDVKDFFKKIVSFKEMNGHWIDELLAELSYLFPIATANFFIERVELAARGSSFDFRAVNYGPYSHQTLRFLEVDEVNCVLETVWHWLTQNRDRDYYFHYAAAHMFEAMFLGSPAVLVNFLQPNISATDERELKIIGLIFREANNNFVFDHVGFVVEILERCLIFSFDIYRGVLSDLYASAISGLRTSAPGEPSPQELTMREKAESVLSRLSRLSPAYELFDDIRKSALADIDRAKRDAEAFDD